MFTIAEVIRLLTRIFAKANKRFPKGLEGVDIRLKAKKIHDVGKANNYQGAISEDQLKQFLAWEKQAPITKEVSKDILKVPKKKGEVVDLTGKKIDEGKPILGGKNVPEEEGFSMTIAEGPQTGKKITLNEFFEMTGAKSDVKQIFMSDKDFKDLRRSFRMNITKNDRQFNQDLTQQIIKREIYTDLSKGQRKNLLDDLDQVSKGDQGLAHGGRSGAGLNYLLGEDDQNSRVPFGSGSGKPPITFTLTGGGGADEGKYNYGGSFGVGGNFPLMGGEVGITGNLPFGRSSNKFGIGESTLGDQWGVNVQGKFPVDFNKMLMGKADGGRIGFGLGGIDKARRLFLKWAGAGAATAGAAKSGLLSIFKGGATKSVIKDLTTVPIKAGADGMPVWFKPFVNKVIKEGDDVSKRFATQERQIVHQSTLPDSKTDVIVTQNLDSGNVSVDIGMGKHGWVDGHFGQPVRLEYRASELIEPPIIKEGKVAGHGKGTKTKEEFWVEEAEFTGGHPENVKFEDVSVEKFGKHASNFDEVEAFATGKIKKTRKISSLQKEGEDLADHFSNYPTPDDFASGGRVPMVFGGRTIGVLKNLFTKMKKSHGIPRGEKSLKSDRFAKSIMSEEDKLKLLQLETKYANSMLESLKIDRQLFKRLETNKEMKDQGLDFLMKHLVDTQTPHMKNYKSLADIDQAILELETLVKNKTLKEGRKLNATGGRVPLAGGKKVSDPGYFMFQEPDEDRSSRYEYDASTPEKMERVRKRMEEAKKELIKRGILERKIFSEKDKIPPGNLLLESIQNFPYEHTPEEYEEYKKVLRSKQEVKDGGRVPLSGGDWVKKRFHEYTKEGRDEFKKEWLDRKDLGMTVEKWNALPLKEKIKIRLREGNASGGLAGMLGE
jgi:hypothetical protein